MKLEIGKYDEMSTLACESRAKGQSKVKYQEHLRSNRLSWTDCSFFNCTTMLSDIQRNSSFEIHYVLG